MNAITTSRTNVPAVALPPLPAPVARALSLQRDRLYPPAPGEEAGYLAPRPEPLDAAGREAAAEAVRQVEAMLRPVTLEHFGAWLMPINAVVANPMPKEDFWFKAGALFMAVSDLPAGAFTAESARAAMKVWKWFPTAAEIASHAAPFAGAIRRDHLHLRDLSERQPGPAGGEWQTPTPGQKERVAAQIAELTKHMRETEKDMTPSKGKVLARPLAPAHLIASYEAQVAAGGPFAPAASIRLEMLRKQVGGEVSA